MNLGQHDKLLIFFNSSFSSSTEDINNDIVNFPILAKIKIYSLPKNIHLLIIFSFSEVIFKLVLLAIIIIV